MIFRLLRVACPAAMSSLNTRISFSSEKSEVINSVRSIRLCNESFIDMAAISKASTGAEQIDLSEDGNILVFLLLLSEELNILLPTHRSIWYTTYNI